MSFFFFSHLCLRWRLTTAWCQIYHLSNGFLMCLGYHLPDIVPPPVLSHPNSPFSDFFDKNDWRTITITKTIRIGYHLLDIVPPLALSQSTFLSFTSLLSLWLPIFFVGSVIKFSEIKDCVTLKSNNSGRIDVQPKKKHQNLKIFLKMIPYIASI